MKWPLVGIAAGVATAAVAGGVLIFSGSYSTADVAQFNKNSVKIGIQHPEPKGGDDDTSGSAKVVKDKKKEDAQKKEAEEKAKVELSGEKVDNLRTDANPDPDFCKKSKLPPGEGKNNKGGTCLSIPIGEVAKNPVKVAISGIPEVLAEGKNLEVKVEIADKFGALDLNAFTFDETGKAGKSFLEGPGELDNDGRPLAHCHLGISTLEKKGGLPNDKYDVVFTGVQGLKGDVGATISGIKAGVYRADVYCSEPGHLSLPTATADTVQAFDTVEFEVK